MDLWNPNPKDGLRVNLPGQISPAYALHLASIQYLAGVLQIRLLMGTETCHAAGWCEHETAIEDMHRGDILDLLPVPKRMHLSGSLRA